MDPLGIIIIATVIVLKFVLLLLFVIMGFTRDLSYLVLVSEAASRPSACGANHPQGTPGIPQLADFCSACFKVCG